MIKKTIKKIKRIINRNKIRLIVELYEETTDRYWDIVDSHLEAIKNRNWEDADMYSREWDKCQLLLDILGEKLDELTT